MLLNRCPVHPALFCTADGSGKLSLWNISNETDVKNSIPILKMFQ